MLEGEKESLSAIKKTGCVSVPEPIAVLDNPKGGGAMLVMEYFDLKGLSSDKARELGENVARLERLVLINFENI